VVAGMAFAVVLSFNLSLGSSNDLSSQNMLVLSQAQAQVIGGNEVECRTNYSPCQIFWCTTINKCTVGCPTGKADSPGDAFTCTY
jgi:hypothetical protein